MCVDSNGNHVNVGNFDAKGLNVNNNWDDNRNDNLGVASARNFNLTRSRSSHKGASVLLFF